jgi:hypothetical protein
MGLRGVFMGLIMGIQNIMGVALVPMHLTENRCLLFQYCLVVSSWLKCVADEEPKRSFGLTRPPHQTPNLFVTLLPPLALDATQHPYLFFFIFTAKTLGIYTWRLRAKENQRGFIGTHLRQSWHLVARIPQAEKFPKGLRGCDEELSTRCT